MFICTGFLSLSVSLNLLFFLCSFWPINLVSLDHSMRAHTQQIQLQNQHQMNKSSCAFIHENETSSVLCWQPRYIWDEVKRTETNNTSGWTTWSLSPAILWLDFKIRIKMFCKSFAFEWKFKKVNSLYFNFYPFFFSSSNFSWCYFLSSD